MERPVGGGPRQVVMAGATGAGVAMVALVALAIVLDDGEYEDAPAAAPGLSPQELEQIAKLEAGCSGQDYADCAALGHLIASRIELAPPPTRVELPAICREVPDGEPCLDALDGLLDGNLEGTIYAVYQACAKRGELCVELGALYPDVDLTFE